MEMRYVGEPGAMMTVVRPETTDMDKVAAEQPASTQKREDGWSDWRELLTEEEEGLLRELEELQRKYGEKKSSAPRMTVSPNIYYSSGGDLARIAQAESAQGVQWVMMDIRSKMHKYQVLIQQDGQKNQLSRILGQMNKVLGRGAGKVRALNREATQKVAVKRMQARQAAQVLEQKRAERRAQQAVEAYRRQRRSRKGGEYRDAALGGGACGTTGGGVGEPAATVTIIPGAVATPPILPGAGTIPGTGAIPGAGAVMPGGAGAGATVTGTGGAVMGEVISQV